MPATVAAQRWTPRAVECSWRIDALCAADPQVLAMDNMAVPPCSGSTRAPQPPRDSPSARLGLGQLVSALHAKSGMARSAFEPHGGTAIHRETGSLPQRRSPTSGRRPSAGLRRDGSPCRRGCARRRSVARTEYPVEKVGGSGSFGGIAHLCHRSPPGGFVWHSAPLPRITTGWFSVASRTFATLWRGGGVVGSGANTICGIRAGCH